MSDQFTELRTSANSGPAAGKEPANCSSQEERQGPVQSPATTYTTGAWTLKSFVDFLARHTIVECYCLLGYAYEDEELYERSVEAEIPQDVAASRLAFLKRFEWQTVAGPSHEQVRRLFNQINTFYAEQWVAARSSADPRTVLRECGALILYRQGKGSLPRLRDIAFGIRKDVDVLDPFRHFKILRGIAPAFLDRVCDVWCVTIDQSPRDPDHALLLSMAIIAIHPLPDGNGRLARLAYTWLCKRWSLEEHWLAEDNTGEFLRTGLGINSTEHLMAVLIKDLCAGHNKNDIGFGQRRSAVEDEQAAAAIESQLRAIGRGESGIVRTAAFLNLRDHLLNHAHFVAQSPRFKAMREVIK